MAPHPLTSRRTHSPSRFDALQPLLLEQLPWGEAALVADFGGARALFNGAMPRFNRALKHYCLEGYVTEHVAILFEASNLYRWVVAG